MVAIDLTAKEEMQAGFHWFPKENKGMMYLMGYPFMSISGNPKKLTQDISNVFKVYPP